MAMTGFICQDDYLAKIKRLSDEEVGRLFRALMVYHASGEEVELEGNEGMAFDFIREDIDRTEKKYADRCETNRRNRLSTTDDERQQSTTNVNDEQRTITTDDDGAKININKKKYKENNKEKEVKEKETTRRFTPPTVGEVGDYCRQRANSIDPEEFCAFYASKGWKVGNQPMKDWKAAVITWEKSDKRKPGSSPPKTVTAQQYGQRDYSDADAEAMRVFLEMNGGQSI